MKYFKKDKKMKLKNILSLLLIATIAVNIHAQDSATKTENINNRSGILNFQEQSFGLATGIDYSIMPLKLNYKRGFEVMNYKFPVMLGADITIPLFKFDLNDIRIKIITETTLLRKSNFEVRFGIDPTFVNTKMQTSSLASVGVDFHIFTGFTGEKWSVGAEVNYNQMVSTHIKHTDKYKDNVLAEAVDGWYKNTAGNINLGLLVNRTMGDVDIYLKTGLSKTAKFNEYLFVPTIYAVIGGSYKF